MGKAAIAVVMDPAGVTAGDCSSIKSEIELYFEAAAKAVE
jgi:phycocyanin beta chain